MRKFLPVTLAAVVAVSATAAFGLSEAAKQAVPSPSTDVLTIAKAKAAPAKPVEKAPEKKEEAKPAADKSDSAKSSEKAPKASPAEIDASIASAQKIESLDLLKNPSQYLNKKVTFTGTFNRFADIALDYKKAFRDSREYVTFFVIRPDVKDHTIPMAELKLFFPRKKSDEVMDLESGDKIQVVGTEFASALDEPWVDVEHIKILEKLPRPDKKHEAPEF